MNTRSTTALVCPRSRALKIAVVAPSLDILGGQGVQAHSLSCALKRDGFEVSDIPINPRFPRFLAWLRHLPVLRTLCNQLLYIPGLIRLRQADVVHIFSASYWSFLLAPVPAMLAAKLFRKPVILNYHSGEAQDHLANWGKRVHPWLRLADLIVVPSTYLQKVFADFGYDSRVIHNIVELNDFRFRQRTPLCPKLLSVRNLEAHYRVDNTLKAFALIKQRLPEATLTIAGYGSEEKALKQLVERQAIADVRFVGRVEPADMPALYDSADIFLNSSAVDNQPLSILEAMAAGLTIITTTPGDIPAMTDNGRCALLVPGDDPEAMAEAVIQLLAEPGQARRRVEKGRDMVATYTWSKVASQWASLYQASLS